MASARTKNRIREHPDIIWTGHQSMDVWGLEGQRCGLFVSKDGWSGWLSMDEVKVVRQPST